MIGAHGRAFLADLSCKKLKLWQRAHVAQTTPTPIRAQILLVASELRQAGSPLYVAQIREILSKRLQIEITAPTISKELRLHGYKLPGRGRPRLLPIPGFSVEM